MAKSLYGHLAADPALVAELTHLRRRVRELETELDQARAAVASAALSPAPLDDQLISLRERAQREAVLR